jgi:hypothetical protein
VSRAPRNDQGIPRFSSPRFFRSSAACLSVLPRLQRKKPIRKACRGSSRPRPPGATGQVQNLGNIEFITRTPSGRPASRAGESWQVSQCVRREKNCLDIWQMRYPDQESKTSHVAVGRRSEWVAVTAVNPAGTGANPLPSGYVDFTLTDADQVWSRPVTGQAA